MFYLLLLLASFIFGVSLGSRFQPKFSFTNNHLYVEYKGEYRQRVTKKVF